MSTQSLQLEREARTEFLGFLLGRLPFQAEYDLSRMRGSTRITFPKRLGGLSITRKHQGIAGKLVLCVDRSEKPGSLAVSVARLDVAVAEIALPLRSKIGPGPKSFSMVSLRLHHSGGEGPTGYLDEESGEITPLDVTLELKAPLLSPGSKPALLRLTLVERLNLADGSLHGTGMGSVAGGLLGGTTFAFAHAKNPPARPPCGVACNCTIQGLCDHAPGHGCGAPGCAPGAATAHGHCTVPGCVARRACNGTCTVVPAGHAGSHACSHGHAF